MQFWPPDDEDMCSKYVEAWNKTYCKTKIFWIKLVKLLTPNVNYSGRTAQLNSKVAFYIFIQQI